MKILGKAVAGKIASLVVLVAIVLGVYFYFQNGLFGLFKGTNSVTYNFVIKRFSQKTQLLVADAEVETTANQTFSNDNVKSWPDWTQAITKLFVGRDITVDIPVKTDFKLDLANVSKNDITITDNTVTFKKPLTIYVDSQVDGEIKIPSQSNGLVDKVVDAATSGQKAQEFLSEKGNEAVYETSQELIEKKSQKTIEYAEKALEDVLNLSSDQTLSVDLSEDSVKFVNSDKK
ncbi:hypothetical protein [Streptococcus loxodontisalivarius]|uniref:DUF4230 domain-containing protein n=1 Tax=Streptococcus loxodontisalivarius TaxID=1349415 RepID=A0ABS2PRG1_9STRE|nr:hypothetical protein [Streptococcus loxodontisalivarius]MBM7642094.1 hypothetical protein [Streptococcus loxodontisalivarius]